MHAITMEDELRRPNDCKLSLEHSTMVTAWGRQYSDYEALTDQLREVIISCYAVNIAEFNLLAPEIRYLLTQSLDPETKALLERSRECLNRSNVLRSPEEKQLTIFRRKIMAKICRSYNRIRREFFPELESIFKPQSELPVALRDDFDEEDDIDVPVRTVQSILDRCLEEEEEERESLPRMSRRQIMDPEKMMSMLTKSLFQCRTPM